MSLKESYYEVAEHIFDDYKNLGYNYNGKLFRNSVSSIYYLDDRKSGVLSKFENMFLFLIDKVKDIKRARNYAIDKRSPNIN
jgi:hypothetical protein